MINLAKMIKVFLFVAIILCIIAQLLPWGRLELTISGEEFPYEDYIDINYGINFYHWGGIQVGPKFPGVPEWYITPTDFTGISDSTKLYGFAFGTLFIYFSIPLAIISLITGIVAYEKFGKKRSKSSLQAGASSLLAIISFIFYMQLSYLLNISDVGVSTNFYWYYGFYMMIISSILFLISFFLNKRQISNEEKIPYKDKHKIDKKNCKRQTKKDIV